MKRATWLPLLLAVLGGTPALAQQPGRVYDVRTFGARGDGHTVDTDGINRAVEAAATAGGGTVYDLVYNPPVTRLLADAERAGCRTIGGLAMLVAQAQEQFRWWTGERPPAGVMRKAAVDALAEFNR